MENEIIKKNIPLPKGGTLEVDVTPKFLKVLKEHFNLDSTDEVGNDHIRMYVWGAFKNAIEKAEKEKL
jgi:hypothetical protein